MMWGRLGNFRTVEESTPLITRIFLCCVTYDAAK